MLSQKADDFFTRATYKIAVQLFITSAVYISSYDVKPKVDLSSSVRVFFLFFHNVCLFCSLMLSWSNEDVQYSSLCLMNQRIKNSMIFFCYFKSHWIFNFKSYYFFWKISFIDSQIHFVSFTKYFKQNLQKTSRWFARTSEVCCLMFFFLCFWDFFQLNCRQQ